MLIFLQPILGTLCFSLAINFLRENLKISKPVASKLSSSELVLEFACLNKFQE